MSSRVSFPVAAKALCKRVAAGVVEGLSSVASTVMEFFSTGGEGAAMMMASGLASSSSHLLAGVGAAVALGCGEGVSGAFTAVFLATLFGCRMAVDDLSNPWLQSRLSREREESSLLFEQGRGVSSRVWDVLSGEGSLFGAGFAAWSVSFLAASAAGAGAALLFEGVSAWAAGMAASVAGMFSWMFLEGGWSWESSDGGRVSRGGGGFQGRRVFAQDKGGGAFRVCKGFRFRRPSFGMPGRGGGLVAVGRG